MKVSFGRLFQLLFWRRHLPIVSSLEERDTRSKYIFVLKHLHLSNIFGKFKLFLKIVIQNVNCCSNFEIKQELTAFQRPEILFSDCLL